MVCPSCGRENPEGFQFCGFCTAPLAASPAPSPQERKVVSVLFCDLVGFTAASESADPEDVQARLRPYHERVRDVLERHGGTVEKFVGDAVMAVFGAPVAHEDDAERAVRAGLRILEAIGELNEADPGLSLQVRVGINSGEAVVALAARPERGEAMVTGDVVNTASRLQGAAPVDGVAVSEETYRATERVFDWEPLGPVTVKGKAQPLAMWRPLQARARLGLDVTRTRSTPLVGRELEKPVLVGAFERAAAQRSCQLVTVVGEPGVGKSRLCAELFGYVEERPGLVRWRQGRCLPYGDGIALWALGEIVKAECGVLETDTQDEAAAKLERAQPADDPDRVWLLARLAPLVGAGGETAALEESFAAWRRFCEGLAAERTTVLVFEDLHWADPALLAFLEHLADWAEGVPLLLLCTARPELYEHHPGFGANARNATRINLAPLTDAETATLVSALLERAVLPAETQQELLERAGGNPLYAEEFVRLLADRDVTHASDGVPESVQALIAARLDTLTPDRKSLLQDAAVVGKVFWAGALAEMGDRDVSEVEQALHELARKELVRPARTSSMAGETEYGFWHVLVRDVCYGQISRPGRVARHEAAAAWLERKAGERVEDLADVLAHHYGAAFELSRAAGIGADAERLRAQAVHYLALAGERALSLDVDQAERQLALALELDPGGTARASVLERWALAVQQQGRLHDAREALGQALEIYRGEGDALAAGRTLPRLALVLHRLGDPSAEEATTEAVELLEQQPPGPELVTAYAYRAGRLTLTGRFEPAATAAQQAITLAAELGLPEPAFALHWRGLARCWLRDAAGVDDMRRALQLALEQGLGRETAVIYGNLAGVCAAFEGPRAGLDLTREALAFNERRGIAELLLLERAGVLQFMAELGETEQPLAEVGLLADELQATGNIGYLSPRALQLRLFAECGRAEQAPSATEFIAAVREIGVPGARAAGYVAAGALLLAQHRHEEARELLRELDQLVITAAELGPHGLCSGVRVALRLDELRLAERLTAGFEPVAPVDDHALVSARAQLAEAAGDQIQAATLYADAADRWQRFGDVPEHAYALLGRGRCLHALGDPAAEGSLTQARDLFATMGYRPALAETQALLGSSQRIGG